MPCLVKHQLNKEKKMILRSHFADGKQPMSVTFEFQLNHRIYKVHRQGPYTKKVIQQKRTLNLMYLRWCGIASMKLEKVK